MSQKCLWYIIDLILKGHSPNVRRGADEAATENFGTHSLSSQFQSEIRQLGETHSGPRKEHEKLRENGFRSRSGSAVLKIPSQESARS